VFVVEEGNGGGVNMGYDWLYLCYLCILGNGQAKCNTRNNYTSDSEKPHEESRRAMQTLQGQSSLLSRFM
jgi:hypothetical protein